MKNIKRLLVLTMLLSLSVLCFGTDYYVDVNNGSNGNSGLIGYPVASINYALDNLVSNGDVIYVANGEYTENVSLNNTNDIYNISIIGNTNDPSQCALEPTTGYGFYIVNSDHALNVKIEGFTVNTVSCPIYYSGSYSNATYEYLTIKSCNFSSSNRILASSNGNFLVYSMYYCDFDYDGTQLDALMISANSVNITIDDCDIDSEYGIMYCPERADVLSGSSVKITNSTFAWQRKISAFELRTDSNSKNTCVYG